MLKVAVHQTFPQASVFPVLRETDMGERAGERRPQKCTLGIDGGLMKWACGGPEASREGGEHAEHHLVYFDEAPASRHICGVTQIRQSTGTRSRRSAPRALICGLKRPAGMVNFLHKSH